MRRVAAIAILLQFLLSAAAPLLAYDSRGNLPACCRRDGRHHCMGHMLEVAQGGIAVRAEDSKCPEFPKPAVTSNHTREWLPSPSQNFYVAVAAHPAIYRQLECSYRVCWSRSQQKRGPPAALS